MIGCVSSQFRHTARQISSLTLKHNIGTSSYAGNGTNRRLMSSLRSARNSNALERTTMKCRFLSSTAGGDTNDKEGEAEAVKNITSVAEKEWQQFNESMMFAEEKDGETVKFTGNKKVRGGKLVRKREMKSILREQALNPSANKERTDVGGGRFPSLRYSDEETQRLLDESYANIPKRTGKRGTRNLKRHRNRWEVIYEQHRQRKEDRIKKHFRTMEKRSRIIGEVKEVLASAENVREEERSYRMEVLRKWADKFHLGPDGEDEGKEGKVGVVGETVEVK